MYVAAIAAYHTSLAGESLGRNPLMSCFLYGSLRLRPARYARVLAWDLAIVLEGLSMVPFEPIESVTEKFLVSGQPSPMAVRAHAKISMEASKDLFSGVSFIECVMRSAGPLHIHL